MQTRYKMYLNGYRAHKVLCSDDNGGLPLVRRWVVVRPDQDKPRPGEITGGHLTREQAWLAAEEWYNRAYS